MLPEDKPYLLPVTIIPVFFTDSFRVKLLFIRDRYRFITNVKKTVIALHNVNLVYRV